MAIINGYNKTTGVTEYWDFDPVTGEAFIREERDVEPLQTVIAETRNTKSADKPLFVTEKEMYCYAVLDPIVVKELYAKGIKLGSNDPEMQMRLIHEINTNYPKYKVTDKHHG